MSEAETRVPLEEPNSGTESSTTSAEPSSPEQEGVDQPAVEPDEGWEIPDEKSAPAEATAVEAQPNQGMRSLPVTEERVALPEGEEKRTRSIPMPGAEETDQGESIPMAGPKRPETSQEMETGSTPTEKPATIEEGEPTSGETEAPEENGNEPARYEVPSPGTGAIDGPLSPEDERRLAAIAHGGVLLSLVTGLGGIAVALVIWLAYRHRSRYVGFQALQAALFQTVALVGAVILSAAAVLLWLIALGALVVLVGLVFIIPAILLTIAAALLPLAALVYGVIGAVDTYHGKDFCYWLVGSRIPIDWYAR